MSGDAITYVLSDNVYTVLSQQLARLQTLQLQSTRISRRGEYEDT